MAKGAGSSLLRREWEGRGDKTEHAGASDSSLLKTLSKKSGRYETTGGSFLW